MIIVALRNLLCFIGLILMMPLLLLACFIVFLEDGMPIIFSQQRLGLNQKIFFIYKLRTLAKDAPQVGTHFLDEQYKLKTGAAIRLLKLDEFPQLLNVLRGELTLVGPRPCLDSQTELKKMRIVEGIFEIKPGITGLSQIMGYDMSDPKSLTNIDKIYIQNKNLRLNLIILLGTFFKFPRNYLEVELNIPYLKNKD